MAYQFHEEAIKTERKWSCFNARSAYIFTKPIAKEDEAKKMQRCAFSGDQNFGQSGMGRLVSLASAFFVSNCGGAPSKAQ